MAIFRVDQFPRFVTDHKTMRVETEFFDFGYVRGFGRIKSCRTDFAGGTFL